MWRATCNFVLRAFIPANLIGFRFIVPFIWLKFTFSDSSLYSVRLCQLYCRIIISKTNFYSYCTSVLVAVCLALSDFFGNSATWQYDLGQIVGTLLWYWITWRNLLCCFVWHALCFVPPSSLLSVQVMNNVNFRLRWRNMNQRNLIGMIETFKLVG
jgi:hypothetical protein